jgi:hypothetical protein
LLEGVSFILNVDGFEFRKRVASLNLVTKLIPNLADFFLQEVRQGFYNLEEVMV